MCGLEHLEVILNWNTFLYQTKYVKNTPTSKKKTGTDNTKKFSTKITNATRSPFIRVL
jgi:hypothetical protein